MIIPCFQFIYEEELFCGAVYENLNLALNKPTWQANQYRPGNSLFHSSNAVDGLKSNLSGRGGQCTLSSGEHRTATWWVNLTSVYSIHDIRIYHRNDNNKLAYSTAVLLLFLGFSVYVSNTTNRLHGYLCFHDTNFTKSTIPAVVNIPCIIHGQYVIYYNERLSKVKYPDGYSKKAFNDICEVEVYDCRTGYYGPNCSLPCPDNCRFCHVETGECQCCEPGYQGYQCEIECKKEKLQHDLANLERAYIALSTEEGTVWRFRFYSTLGAVFVSVTVNTVFIIIICLKWKRRETKVPPITKEFCTPVQCEANNIYENIPGEYQELQKLGESSHYDAMQQKDG
ncbi:uncharacterized protein LOC133203125 [Saccostrea echinata]|uniref:uncharacterized protein LOC133203125 n=1 Tax=Saccostrea echinata TaxID=191078 RepID=UPI002A81BD23|nr:uncharacterized protein LOC133203125 [Saccostrea echinata]